MRDDNSCPDRRRFLKELTGAALASSALVSPARAWSPQCPPNSIPAGPTALPSTSAAPLGRLAQTLGLQLGCQIASAPDQSYGSELYDAAYRTLISREQPRFVACGNGFKFVNLCVDDPKGGPLLFSNSTFDIADTWWEAKDTVRGFKPLKIAMRADALIWQSNSPSWLRALPSVSTNWSKSSSFLYNQKYMVQFISAAMKNIIQMSANDPNYFVAIGLVNEPISSTTLLNGAPTYAGGPFQPAGVPCSQNLPASYLSTAFAQARYYNTYWAKKLGLAKTNAKFFINERGADTDQFGPIVRSGLLSIISAMHNANVQIDGIGLECHLQPQMMANVSNPDWTAFGNFLQTLQDLGLEVYITELDVCDYEVNCGGKRGLARDSDALTNLYYSTFLSKVLGYACVKSVCLWDLSDRYSFYRQLDMSQWSGYNTVPRPKPANVWPHCPTMPANPGAIACPRPAVFNDAMAAKSARQAVANALASAPVLTR